MISFEDLNWPRECGKNLRYEPVYSQIQEARVEEDAYLSMGVWERDLKRADWNKVDELCSQSLQTETLDLQMTCWLCESWLHLYEWEGVSHAFHFFDLFLENGWNLFYPLLSEDTGQEHRIRILEWFFDKSHDAILFIPLNHLSGTMSQQITMADWLSAANAESISRRTGKESEGTMTLTKFRSIFGQIPGQRLTFINTEISNSLNALKRCKDFLIQACPDQSPSLTPLQELLQNIQKMCPIQTQEIEQNTSKIETDLTINESEPLEPIEIQPQEVILTPEKNEAVSPSEEEVTISGKKDAYQALDDLANYLIELDQQSPVPYLVKLAASWHDKSLPDLLKDVDSGQTQGHQILKMFAEIIHAK